MLQSQVKSDHQNYLKYITPSKSRLKILIVDDDDLLISNVKAFLGTDSFIVKHAHNGQEGFEAALDWVPEIIISDIMMPLMGGFEFCQKIRKCEDLQSSYFIFLTSKMSKQDMIRGLKIGADDYLTKPFSVEELKARILVGTRTLQQRKKIKDLVSQLALVNSQSSISSLCASMSHELNSPLGAVYFNNKTIKKNIEKIEDPELRETLTSLVSDNEVALSHMKKISSSVKKMTRSQLKNETSLVDVREEVETALLLVSHRVCRSKIRLIKKYSDNVPELNFKSGALAQVLVNLLMNSLDALADEGTIVIEVSSDNQHIFINVSDDGSGIKPSVVPYIFDPFFSTKNNETHSGLGLSISQEVMRENNGEIYVSHSELNGTLFTLKCPIHTIL